MSLLLQFHHDYQVNHTLDGRCIVGLDGFLGSALIPSSMKLFHLILFSLCVAYVILTYLWMWRRRHAPLLRKRGDYGLILMSSIGGMVGLSVIFREHYGRDLVPCPIVLWISVLAPPLLIGPTMVRLILFRNKAVFYEQMKTIAFDVYLASKDQKNLRNLKLAVSDPNSFLLALQALNIQQFVPLSVGARMSMQTKAPRTQSLGLTPELKKQAEFGRGTLAAVSVESVNTGYYTSSAFASILLFVFVLPFIIYGVVITVLTPYYHNFECMGCELTLLDLVLPGFGFLSTLLVVAGISQRIYGVPDPFSISKELLSIVGVFCIFGLLTALFLITDPGGYGAKGYITWHYFYCIMVFLIQTIQCLIPTLRTYRAIPLNKRGSSGGMDLETLLNDPTGVVLFQEHMATEFNVESLRFYLEAEKWKAAYDHLDQAQVCKRAYEIFRTFIERGSYMECNISDEVRRAMEKEVTWVQANGWKSVPKTFFDKPLAEVWRLMSMDSFPRFVKSKIYKEWSDSAPSRSPSQSASSTDKVASKFDMIVSGIVTHYTSPLPSASASGKKEKSNHGKHKDDIHMMKPVSRLKSGQYIEIRDVVTVLPTQQTSSSSSTISTNSYQPSNASSNKLPAVITVAPVNPKATIAPATAPVKNATHDDDPDPIF